MDEIEKSKQNFLESYKVLLDNAQDLSQKIENKLTLIRQKEAKFEEIENKMKENASKAKSKVILDIGGKRFATSKSTLLNIKGSYFYTMLSSSWKPDDDGTYFIDRNPKLFDRILDYMRTGELNISDLGEYEMKKLQKDLDYFQLLIPDSLLYQTHPPPQAHRLVISKSSHPHYLQYVATNILKPDDDYWASSSGVKQPFIVFFFGEKCKISSFSLRHRGDQFAPEKVNLSFSDSADGPWINQLEFIPVKNKKEKQTFSVTAIGSYCKVGFTDSENGRVNPHDVWFVCQEISFSYGF
eukprot:TRINITY_DN4576_c0_g1_i1.p1 TRINITY_DN4576_c0_g1~~TRINITY_DN4576_c0_g1_i1.p1  ORF type:complete len:297 (-),score=65.85 TRINITY_DN4576_c0_g1_i1:11-901(-)